MKLVSFSTKSGSAIGAVIEDNVVNLTAAGLKSHCMNCLLGGGTAALKAAAKLAERAAKQKKFCKPLAKMKLLPPVPKARKLFCLAGNYAEHFLDGGKRATEADKATPRVFMKPPSTTLRGPRDPITIPPVGRKIDWEAELAVVIGKGGKAIKAEDAFKHVAGYMVINDVSERDFFLKPRPETREWDKFFDWLNGKWFDSFAPCGPWLVTADEIPDPHSLDITLEVNGTKHQQGNTGQMIFLVKDIIAWISSFVALEPGDIIATGTCAGCGIGKGVFLKPGDVMRTTISRIGTLDNKIVAG